MEATRESDEPRASRTRGLTTADLVSQLERGLGLASFDDDRRAGQRVHLEVAGAALATLSAEPGAITTVCATSGRDMPLHDLLAAIAGQRPKGVVVLEGTDGEHSRAFLLDEGSVVAAVGERLNVQAWTAIVVDEPIEQATSTVAELMLDALAVAHESGARMTWLRGDIEWLGARLDPELAPSLQHLIFEHVRRIDELPRILERLAPLQRRVVAKHEPPVDPPKHAPPGSKCLDLDFFAHPDGAALREWADARVVFGLADGRRSAHDVLEAAEIGSFRALAGLDLLVRCNYVELAEPSDATAVPPIGRVLLRPEGTKPATANRPTPTLAFDGARSTRYSLGPEQARKRIDRVAMPTSPIATPNAAQNPTQNPTQIAGTGRDAIESRAEAVSAASAEPAPRDRGESEETGLDEILDGEVTLSTEVPVETAPAPAAKLASERRGLGGFGVLVGLMAAAAAVGYMLLPLH